MAKKRSVTPHGDKIRLLRLKKGWSKQDLADKADRSAKTIENAENGVDIDELGLALIARALDADYEYLLVKFDMEIQFVSDESIESADTVTIKIDYSGSATKEQLLAAVKKKTAGRIKDETPVRIVLTEKLA